MPDSESAFSVNVWGTDRNLVFPDRKAVAEWVKQELEVWESIKPTHPKLVQLWSNQLSPFQNIRAQCEIADAPRPNIDKQFRAISEGRAITRDSPYFSAIWKLAEHDPNAAVLAVSAIGSAADTVVGVTNNGYPLATLYKSMLTAISDQDAWVRKDGALLQELKNRYDREIGDLRVERDRLKDEIDALLRRENSSHESRNAEWKTQLQSFQSDWENLRKLYDTELGLRAPKTYWDARGKKHRNIAIAFALGFALVLATAIVVFVNFGLPQLLQDSNKSPSVILIPILLPAFACIWVLRILGRLLSENIRLVTDAGERGTLVQTFLALMNDKTTGKAVIKDEDRILILHALFRPSSITATDDAPPVHWFDLLLSRKSGGR